MNKRRKEVESNDLKVGKIEEVDTNKEKDQNQRKDLQSEVERNVVKIHLLVVDLTHLQNQAVAHHPNLVAHQEEAKIVVSSANIVKIQIAQNTRIAQKKDMRDKEGRNNAKDKDNNVDDHLKVVEITEEKMGHQDMT